MKSMRRHKIDYLDSCGEAGGNAAGFRSWIEAACEKDPTLFPYNKMRDDAADKEWQRSDPADEEDLFTASGAPIPYTLTRYARGFTGADDGFEKIRSKYAILQDYYDNAIIKLRNAASTSAAADALMKGFDILFKAAGGDMTKRLKDLI